MNRVSFPPSILNYSNQKKRKKGKTKRKGKKKKTKKEEKEKEIKRAVESSIVSFIGGVVSEILKSKSPEPQPLQTDDWGWGDDEAPRDVLGAIKSKKDPSNYQ